MTPQDLVPYLGAWVLDPAKNDYPGGGVPTAGRYTLTETPEGLHFAMAWTDAEGEAHEMEYTLQLAGRSEVQGAQVELAVEARGGLVTRVYVQDALVAEATRVLDPDGRGLAIGQRSVAEGPTWKRSWYAKAD